MKRVLKDKRNRIIVGITAICILTVIIGVAYAYIAYYARQKETNIVKSSCIYIEYTDVTNAINLNDVYPLTDEAGETLSPYKFKIKNTCNVGVDYSINLEVLDIENRIPSNNIAAKIDKEQKKVLIEELKTKKQETTEYVAIEAYKLYTGTLEVGEEKEHELRLWLDESAGNESQNKEFQSKIVIEATQNQIALTNFTEYIMNQSEIEAFTHEATEQTPSLTDYRYTGANPNNYVYFGCSENCTEDNLYRIIGVIPTQSSENSSYKNRVKLIKANYYTEEESGLLKDTDASCLGPGGKGYNWNSSANNKWEESTLQNQVLNGVYWSSLGEYQKYIDPAVWYLGAPAYSSYTTYTPDQFYNIERSNMQGYSKGATSYINHIGLMYPSDYGYSIGSSNKGLSVYDNGENYKNNAWLYNLENKYYEWTILPESIGNNIRAWSLHANGSLNGSAIYALDRVWGIRPTFYLKENIVYAGGNGSKENPYKINEETIKFSDYIIKEKENDPSIEMIEHEATEQTGLNASIDYRYVGSNPNNYIYFGCNTNCTEDNLYRIIGVIPTQSTEDGPYENRVKLIKAKKYENVIDGTSSYYWSENGNSNDWSKSSLNMKVLNYEYWNSLGEYQSYIEQAKWYLGAPSSENFKNYSPNQFYKEERNKIKGKGSNILNILTNIGLMYPSDYGYSLGINSASKSIFENYEQYVTNAWLYNVDKTDEWTIAPEAVYSIGENSKEMTPVFYIVSNGVVSYSHVSIKFMIIRPTFYLKSNVLYSSGDGSISNPYRIGL